MSKSAPHLIFVMTDQHARYASGAYGSATIRTPNLDRLATSGTVFDAAYCSSPMCVPSRASIMTGLPVHDIEAWDNAHPYRGEPRGWSHALRDAGIRSTVIGKMHFQSAEADTGFSETILPLDVAGGVGDVYSLIRDDMPARPALADLVRQAGVGSSPYLPFDRSVAEAACAWLDEAPTDEPWALTVSFATPHHPLLAPQDYWDMYPAADLPPQWQGPPDQHAYPAELRRVMGVDVPFEAEEVTRARRAYYALCTLADDLVGSVLDHAVARGFDASNTVVIYTSDHGASLGERGLWWKHHLYEESVAVPLMASGPGFPAGARVAHPVSLTSIYETVIDIFELERGVRDPKRTGSLRDSSAEPAGGFAQYHGLGASSAAYMLREGPLKLIYFATQAPQLFDLDSDPDELENLAEQSVYADVLSELIEKLFRLVDPVALDERARLAQAQLVDKLGGRAKILDGGFTIPFTPPA